MKVLLVNGSPHEFGCTYTALAEAAKTLESEGISTEFFWLGTKPLSGCIGCGTCRKAGKCVFDDKVNEFLEKAKEADGFLFGSPVHYAAASGALTSFMDRAFYAGAKELYALKPAAAVVSARRAGTTAAFEQVNKYFTISEMPVISSCYWNMVHGSNPDDVKQDEEGLYTMRLLAKNMAFFLKCKKIALENGLTLPEKEPRVFTNFIR